MDPRPWKAPLDAIRREDGLKRRSRRRAIGMVRAAMKARAGERIDDSYVGRISQPPGGIGLSQDRGVRGEVPAGDLQLVRGLLVCFDHLLGKRDTIEILNDDILRCSVVGERLVFEYAGRESGECYAVDPTYVRLCMVRRAHNSSFTLPDPPAPLPLSNRADFTAAPERPLRLGAPE